MSAGEDLKSSAHVWGDGEAKTDSIEDSPPAYSGSTPVTSPPPDRPTRPRRKPLSREPYNPVQAIARWAKIPWGRYVVPEAVVSADKTTITTTHPTFYTNQQALIKLLADQAELPPIPMIRIAGSHSNYNGIQQPDFDISVNLSSLLDISKPARWHNKPAQVVPLPSSDGRTWASSSVSGNNAVQIDALVRQFLRDKSDRKSFMLARTVENLPTDVIEGLVRNLIASLHYRGKLTVSFPVQCGQVIVQKKPGGTGAAVGGWFMNVLGLTPDIKYESLERVWEVGTPALPFGDAGRNNQEGGESSSSDQGHISTLIKEWWNAWEPAIRDAVLLKKQGKVGIEDWIEAQMGWRPKPVTQDWGVDYT